LSERRGNEKEERRYVVLRRGRRMGWKKKDPTTRVESLNNRN
jgi:hypothetical protein